MRYFLELSYLGTQYCGWQRQPNAPSVQQSIEDAIKIMTRHSIEVVGCGRTDTGVHASHYMLHVDLEETIDEPGKWVYRLNAILPADISIHRLIPVHPDAHARFDAQSRTYQYHIHFNKNPFLLHTSVYRRKVPDISLMNKACEVLLNTDDFTSFAKLHADNKTNRCKVTQAIWTATETGMVFTISADRFLRNMVRAVVGTSLEIGEGKQPISHMSEVIKAQDRSAAGMSVDAKGLFLTHISYPYIP
ncbi:MAG TPA: tRNA pseudouridine(38-40) synthase TruA [Luteibaculaceae bacterium]|nr:tRNA pseudouridine(38-40) synthase TruA [Luteibaculaceae bacterium]